MIDREEISIYVIKASLGLGGSLLAAIFVSEAYIHGGFMIPFSIGVFAAVGLCARFFGGVRLWVYCLATIALTSVLLLVGLPR
ncbi:MAG TPA: hypothetical protein VLY65_00930 [Nitrososphaerales archaeon]|nr:hypothetical protein [Nitrososphaerales archaeon]